MNRTNRLRAPATCLALLAALATGLWSQGPSTTNGDHLVLPHGKLLPNPPAAQIPALINTFMRNEAAFRHLLRHDYTYDESIQVDNIDDDTGKVKGTFEQINQITFDTTDRREIVCTYCPESTLEQSGLILTEQDLNDFFNRDFMTISLRDINDYNVRYVDHEMLGKIGTYLFEISPKRLAKGHRYFQGKVWVSDKSLQIVHSLGQAVPNFFDSHGQPINIFLPFETWRQKIDGRYWFPVFTRTDTYSEALHARVRMLLHFTNYKRFSVGIRIVPGAAPLPTPTATPAPH